MKVAVIGAPGRMGSATCRAVEADPDLQLVARIGRADDVGAVAGSGADVAVEFTNAASVKQNVRACVAQGVHVVVGATGLSQDDLREIRGSAEESGANVFVAPNFAIGAVLMMRFAAASAPHFDSAEIVERHHQNKLDSPSGTALRTADLMNEARSAPWRQPREERETLPGSRGGNVDGVRVHSLRIPGSVAHQEVVLGRAGETLTIRHDSLDLSSFMPGVVLAIKNVASLGPLTVGLEHLLDLGS
ncbi:MAG: 4-hydroxy-tetrahydrodipicolinate reductase [Actinomycetota bacterium]|nr:4-hydroxy-tetrahydrodipicolinate reductase [Actinomycetota bacterium]